MRNGLEVTVEQASKMDYEEGEQFLQMKRYRDASQRYQGIVSQMPTSSYADNALLRLAQIQRLQKKPDDAVPLLQTLIARYPKGDAANFAKEDLGKILFNKKEYRSAAEILSAVQWKELPIDRRESLEKIARSAFEKGQLTDRIFPWLVSVFDATAEPRRALDLRNEIIEALDRSSNPADLERIVETRDEKFPADYAAFKLAKLAYHAGDAETAKRWVTRFLNRHSGHEYAQAAVALSETLYRSDDVDSRAIGLLVPLSGSNRIFADQMLQGAALAMNVFQKTNSGVPFTLYIEDTGEDPERAVAALERLVRERKVIAAVGPLLSKQSQSVALTALDYGLPVISLSAAEGITELGSTIFRNGLTKSAQASGLAHLAIDILGTRRAAILYPRNKYGIEFMTFFFEEFTRRGGEIRGAESYEPDKPDFGPPLKRLVGLEPIELRQNQICSEAESKARASDPTGKARPCYPRDNLPPIVDFEAIFIPDGFDRVQQIVPTLAYYDVRGVQVLGTNVWNTPELLKGDSAKYLQGALFLDGFFPQKKEPPTPEFMERFYRVYGSEAGILEAQTYDTVSMALSVLSNDRPDNRRAFAEALNRIAKYPGVTGETDFSGRRDAVRKLTVLTVDGDKIVELD